MSKIGSDVLSFKNAKRKPIQRGTKEKQSKRKKKRVVFGEYHSSSLLPKENENVRKDLGENKE